VEQVVVPVIGSVVVLVMGKEEGLKGLERG